MTVNNSDYWVSNGAGAVIYENKIIDPLQTSPVGDGEYFTGFMIHTFSNISSSGLIIQITANIVLLSLCFIILVRIIRMTEYKALSVDFWRN